MAQCRTCDAEIAWGWQQSLRRWCPVELDSVTGEEQPFESGALLESWNRRHRCRASGNARSPGRTSYARPEVLVAYAALHLLPTAPPQVVDAAWRALAKIHHPDCGGDPERMKAINVARDRLLGVR